jgi:hypothetical protein
MKHVNFDDSTTDRRKKDVRMEALRVENEKFRAMLAEGGQIALNAPTINDLSYIPTALVRSIDEELGKYD